MNDMLKKKLKEGRSVLGTWCVIPSPVTIEIMAKAGFDFVIIDMEHGPMDFTLAQAMVTAADGAGCAAVVRVPCNDEVYVMRALDIGAAGIIVPQITCVADREKVVRSSKFAPLGERGINPYVRAGGYNGDNPDYYREQNEGGMLGIILEGRDALRDLERIIADPSVDMVYVGTYDISAALGVPGAVNSEAVIDALHEAVNKINAAGKAAGCLAHTAEEVKRFKERGIRFITYQVDSALLYRSCLRVKTDFDAVFA